MKKEVEIKASPRELAELLFDLDSKEVGEVFSEWSKLFEEEYQRRKAANETIWIFDLTHFFMYVAKDLDEDGVKFFRDAYTSILYQFCDDIHKKHLVELNLKTA